MSETIIKIEDLQNEAKNYDGVLRALPFLKLEELRNMGVNLVDVQGKDVITNRRRAGGILGPYSQGQIKYNQELGKIVEMTLEPTLTAAAFRDNIQNYKAKKIVGNKAAAPDNKTKEHPLERQIIEDVVITVGEDVLFSSFFAERDETVKSPMTAFTGFFPILDECIAKGMISADEGNLVATGAFADPAGDDTDTSAYDLAVEFLGSAHPLLKRGGANFAYSTAWLQKVKRAYMNRVKNQKITNEDVFAALRDDAFFDNLNPVKHPAYGIGDRLMVYKPGLLDLGMDTQSASQFVEVRKPFEDPNEIQYWIQFGVGTRVRDIHSKVLLINDQANSASALSGDYTVTPATSEGTGE